MIFDNQYFILVPVIFISIFTILVAAFHSNWRVSFLVFISTTFGFILKFGDIGYNRSFQSIVKELNFYQMRLLFIVLFFTNIFCDTVHSVKPCPLFNSDCKKYEYSSSASPIGISLLIGATLFGIGMNLAMCCASGTFMRLGTGNVKTIVVLLFFICGFTFSVIDPIYNSHTSLPKFNPVELHFGFTLLILLILYFGSLFVDFIKHKKGYSVKNADFVFFYNLFNSNSLDEDYNLRNKWVKQIFFCIGLALTMTAFYLCFGFMMGVSGVFQTLGANFLKLFGAHPGTWTAFNGKEPEKNLLNLTIFDSDIFIFLGSFLASSIEGVFGKVQENTLYHYIRACVGGFLMGVGSKMAYGCNIGSMTSGIAGNSLHGFIWMLCATFGSWISVCILNIIDKCLKPKEVENSNNSLNESDFETKNNGILNQV